jgi:hypothetical protein
MCGGTWIDADRVKPTRRQVIDQRAIAAADVQNSRADRHGIEDDRVEAAPPTIVSHSAGMVSTDLA